MALEDLVRECNPEHAKEIVRAIRKLERYANGMDVNAVYDRYSLLVFKEPLFTIEYELYGAAYGGSFKCQEMIGKIQDAISQIKDILVEMEDRYRRNESQSDLIVKLQSLVNSLNEI